LLSFLRKELKKEDIDLPDLGEILRKAKAGELDLGRIDKDMRRTP
jgi:hypothetical protein